ncbi:MAG TPA: porphobilinogen synthase [Spirochaetota bacterium]|nr:porphobilinogen synthase [Spirochaetota bacterium]HPC41837.1 porphobilinogen synthase [Spirochaetota bacterium]HQF07558.1 porphobilinogen synthase [Spirochaetota bacterium]HQH96289.1 porphobilinogen synthase [Spirochaetota bacterium]HQJ69463.1 porphobilinogen synthase [Spirochaetota bacterium]
MTHNQRPRRNRASYLIRDLVAETFVDRRKLIMPHFVLEGKNLREPIVSMPGISRVSIENLLKDIEADHKTGIDKILLFGIPDKKDEEGSGAYDRNGIVQKALREIKKHLPGILVITDVCLCEYTSHGHCGMVDGGNILNDPTLEILSRVALSHAESGSDMIAPSDMMDGRVGAIRTALDAGGFDDIPILAYSAKYSSAFYGPFREAAGSAPQFGDRSSYQMDCRNGLEAEKEILLDIAEGADIVMVKPALSYLDVIYRARKLVNVPVCAYNVSGEYSMVKAMAKLGYSDEVRLAKEIITSIFRAGADMIISYHTRDIFRNNWF